MSIKEVQAHVIPDQTSCRRCGYPRLQTVTRAAGDMRLWFAVCPACQSIEERASIPEWFLEGLPPPPDRQRLH